MDENWNLIGTKEVADILGVKHSTVNGWMFRNAMPFPYYKVSPRCIRFKKTEVLEYLKKIKNG